jgi:hypothetical protein
MFEEIAGTGLSVSGVDAVDMGKVVVAAAS